MMFESQHQQQERNNNSDEEDNLGPPNLLNTPCEVYFNSNWSTNLLPSICEAEEDYSYADYHYGNIVDYRPYPSMNSYHIYDKLSKLSTDETDFVKTKNLSNTNSESASKGLTTLNVLLERKKLKSKLRGLRIPDKSTLLNGTTDKTAIINLPEIKSKVMNRTTTTNKQLDLIKSTVVAVKSPPIPMERKILLQKPPVPKRQTKTETFKSTVFLTPTITINGNQNSDELEHIKPIKPSDPIEPVIVRELPQPRYSIQPKKRQMNGRSTTDGTFEVVIHKDECGFGIAIDGGFDSPDGNKPLTIKKIFMGGAAEKTGKLSVGNEIITINGQSTAQMTRVGVWNFMKTLPMGPILMVIKS